MSLSRDAQRAAERQATQARKTAEATVSKAREQQLEWVRERTGIEATFRGDLDLALGEYHGETPVCVTRSYPCFNVDDVVLAYDRRARELFLVCSDENLGDYIGPRVFTIAGRSATKAQRKRALIQNLGTALNTAALHPILVLREAQEACPTCGRSW